MFNVKSPMSDAIVMIWTILIFVWILIFIIPLPNEFVNIWVKLISIPVIFIFTILIVKYIEWEDARYERKQNQKENNNDRKK